jgi:hypothetical protein
MHYISSSLPHGLVVWINLIFGLTNMFSSEKQLYVNDFIRMGYDTALMCNRIQFDILKTCNGPIIQAGLCAYTQCYKHTKGL